jgi:hypothetical protein
VCAPQRRVVVDAAVFASLIIGGVPAGVCQTEAQREEVRTVHAEYLFAQGEMSKAAKRYAETRFPFEEVRCCAE